MLKINFLHRFLPKMSGMILIVCAGLANAGIQSNELKSVSTDALRAKANTYKRAHLPDQAVIYWREILKRLPKDDESLAALVRIEFDNANVELAKQYLRRLIATNDKYPEIPTLKLLVGDLGVDDYQVGAENYSGQGSSSSPWSVLKKAEDLRANSQYAKAVDLIDTLDKYPSNKDANFAAAIFYFGDKNWEKSIEYLRKIPAAAQSQEMINMLNQARVFSLVDQAKMLYKVNGAAVEAAAKMSEAQLLAKGNLQYVSIISPGWIEISQPLESCNYIDSLNSKLNPEMYLLYGLSLMLAGQDAKLFVFLDKYNNGLYDFKFSKDQQIKFNELNSYLADKYGQFKFK